MRSQILLLLAASTAASAASAGEGLRLAFERTRYALEDSGHGAYRGENPAQRLTLEFGGGEARLSHPGGSLSFHLAGYGYGDRLQPAPRARLSATGNRMEYQRGDLTEWYLNGSQGLEQGFTLARRPGANPDGAPLAIAIGVSGPVKQAGDGALLFAGALRYAGLKAVDARGRVLPARMEARGGEIRLTVEDRDALYPVVVDPTWTQQAELTASDGAANDFFGWFISLSGDTAVIGASEKNGLQGAAYVYVRSGGAWTQQQKLTASDGVPGDVFAGAVAVSGDTAVIGAPGKNNGQGVAYVYVRSGGVWTQQLELTASDGAAGDGFAEAVAVSGDTAVIGSPTKNSWTGSA